MFATMQNYQQNLILPHCVHKVRKLRIPLQQQMRKKNINFYTYEI